MVLTGDEALKALTEVEVQVLDPFHKHFALFTRSRGDGLIHLLRAYEFASNVQTIQGAFVGGPLRMLYRMEAVREGLRYALDWAFALCPEGGPSSESTDDSAMVEAVKLLRHAEDYAHLADAHVSVRRGSFAVTYETNSRVFRFGFTEEGIQTAIAASALRYAEDGFSRGWSFADTFPAFDTVVRKCARQTGPGRIEIDWSVAATDEARAYGEGYTKAVPYELPGEWDLGGYTLAEFRSLWQHVMVVSEIQTVVHLLAGRLGITRDLCMDSWVPVRHGDDWKCFLTELSGLERSVVSAVVDDLTYDPHIRNADPALQPFVPVGGAGLALCLGCVRASNPERNLLKALNRMPHKQRIYSELSPAKEDLFLAEVIAELASLPLRYATKREVVVGGELVTEIDLLIWHEKTGTLLMVELKWPIGAHDVNEVAEDDRAFERAANEQVVPAMAFLEKHGCDVLAKWIPGTDASKVKHIHGVIVSKTSPGTGKVFSGDVPVVEWLKFRQFLSSDGPRDLRRVHRRCLNPPDRKQMAKELVFDSVEVVVGPYTYVCPGMCHRGDLIATMPEAE